MRIPKYWAKDSFTGKDRDGKELTFDAWGWSFECLDQARIEATARAKRIFDHLTSHVPPDTYDYLHAPLREEIVETLQAGDKEIALISRNRYGALVLNSASVCFVDIDFPKVPAQGFLDSILLLFSKAKREIRATAARDVTIDYVRSWACDNPDRSFRLYRTKAGLRLLFTDQLYDPTAPETDDLLLELGSDPLYRKLTEKQECFRARLTPKPWRCGCARPPHRYPLETAKQEKQHLKWQSGYEKASKDYAICLLLETIGVATPDEQIDQVVAAHDRCVTQDPTARLA